MAHGLAFVGRPKGSYYTVACVVEYLQKKKLRRVTFTRQSCLSGGVYYLLADHCRARWRRGRGSCRVGTINRRQPINHRLTHSMIA